MQEIDELIRAIIALEAKRTELGDGVVSAAISPLLERLAEMEQHERLDQQRRLVTVLFLDIVNSTLLSQGLEPEEVQEVMGGALKRISAPIETYGGEITQFMGDGFVAVFGLTRARENDARQAVRAALAILMGAHVCAEELAKRYNLKGFQVRLGINTGRVVAGRFSEAESPVMGLTVSLAARMEQAAQPDTVTISQFTYQHVRGAFEFEPLPAIEAKGFSQAIEAYKVIAAIPRTFRTFTRGVEGITTSLIGRDGELKQLKAVMTRAFQNQETQLVTITGEAGVGKSRLLYEFDRWIARGPRRVICFKGRASPQMMRVPFGLLRFMISYHMGLLITDTAQVTRQRLVDEVSLYLTEACEMKAHFIGSVLGFDFSESPYLRGLEDDPKQLHERGQLYLTQYLSAVAGKSASMILLDDIHWADKPSLDFIAHLVEACPRLQLMVVCLGRPIHAERPPDWDKEGRNGEQAPIESLLHQNNLNLDLKPLSRQDSLELLNEILHSVESLPATLRDQILDKAEGNPFYLEEYIQTLIDTKIIRKGQGRGGWGLDFERLDRLELPTTLIALLEARLDSLDATQKEILQQAAVIGRIFWRSALQSIRGEKHLSDVALEALSRRGFIYPLETTTFAGTTEYQFHHVLLRDVAYQALVKSSRQKCHGQAAAWLIGATEQSGRISEFAPLIAEHYELADMRNLAADWYTRSGARARNQGAPTQARAFFDRALALIPSSSQEPADLARRWQALLGRDEALGILGDSEARTADDIELVTLAQLIGDDHLLADAYYRQGYYLSVRGQNREALDAYNLGLAAAERVEYLTCAAEMLSLKVICEIRLGDLAAAAQTASAALACAEKVGGDEILGRTLTNVSAFYTETGDLAKAAQLLNQQLTINQRAGNMEGEVVGLSNLGYAYILMGMPEKAIPALQRCIEMAQAIGHRFFCVYGRLNLALAFIRGDDALTALVELAQCLPELKDLNDEFGYAVGETYTGMAKEHCGTIHEALEDFKRAAVTLNNIGALSNAHDAEAGMARCLLELGNQEEARNLIAPVWEYLQQQKGAGMEFPLLAYQSCAEVYSAAGEATLVKRVIESGYAELMARANKISLMEWRQSFLERVPEHQYIRARWQEYSEKNKV